MCSVKLDKAVMIEKYDDECDGATDVDNDDEPADGKRKGAADEHHASETNVVRSNWHAV